MTAEEKTQQPFGTRQTIDILTAELKGLVQVEHQIFQDLWQVMEKEDTEEFVLQRLERTVDDLELKRRQMVKHLFTVFARANDPA